jgi:hypothetical protein
MTRHTVESMNEGRTMTAEEAERHLAGQVLVRAMHRRAGAYASGNARRIAKAEADYADAVRRVDAVR